VRRARATGTRVIFRAGVSYDLKVVHRLDHEAARWGSGDAAARGRRHPPVRAPAAPQHAGLMTAAEKTVVTSRPLGDPGWGPTTVITGDVAAAITGVVALRYSGRSL
jgi:hypothetical protein